MIQNNIEESCNLINPDSDHRVNILRIAHKCVRFFPKNLVPPQKSTDRFFDADFDVLGRCDVNCTF
jgi:hypothetical protein